MAVRTDNERLGFFSEPAYISIGDKYKSDPGTKPFNTNAYKKKQMMTTSTKSKATGSGDGYIDGSFKRMMAGEAAYDPVRIRRKEQLKEKKKQIVPNPFAYTGPVKKLAGSGSSNGTFAGAVKYMDPKEKGKGKYQSPKRNFTTNPSKKGSGYGYLEVTIGQFPKYQGSPYMAEQTKERKAAKAAKAKMVGAGAFKLNAPDEGGLFTKDPYKLTKAQPVRKTKAAPAKKVLVPFYPTKPPPSMRSGGKNVGTMSKFTYVGEKPAKKEKKKGPLKGNWRPISDMKGKVTSSITTMNATRSMTRSNFKSKC